MTPGIRWLRVVWCLALGVALFGVCAAVAQSTVEDLYAITADKKLLRVNLDNGAGTLVATLNVEGNPYGLASLKYGHGESAQLWVVTTSNRLYRVEHDTGRLLATNSLFLPAASGGGLAWSPILYPGTYIAQTLNSTGILMRVNPAAGTSVVIGALSPPMEGLETSYDGNLFGLSAGSSPSLYRIDRTNGTTALIGSLGINVPGFPFGALAMYGGLPGEIYAAMSSVNESRLYELDASGAATLRGQIGFPRVAGLAFHVRQPGPLSIRRVGTNVLVSWPETNGGYLWRRPGVTGIGIPEFNRTFPATNAMQIFYLSPHPPF